MHVSVTDRRSGDGYDPEEEAAAGGEAGGLASGAGRLAGVTSGLRERAQAFVTLLERPLTPYYLITGIATLLLSLGLLMVMSTGSVYDLSLGISAYADFEKQLIGVAVGLPLLWIAARSSPRLFRAAAYPLIAVSVIGLLLTQIHGVGQTTLGGGRWIRVGSFDFQPSELAKLGLAVWGADLLARKEKLGLLVDWRHMLIPLLPGTAVLALLVMAGDDLGTTSILLVIFLLLLWVAGTPSRVFVALVIVMGLVLVLLIVTAGYRSARITDFLHPSTNPVGPDMQAIQGKIALGNGGIFGVGVGASRSQWGWVPEDTTDFIFAIIGEEFGLAGTLCVTALYGCLAYAGLRVARASADMFSRLLAATITGWIVIQAAVNIGGVIGVLPITGVPLPLVSAGDSSLLVTLVALGMLLSLARRTPGAAAALAARGPGGAARVLSLVGLGKRQEEHG